MNKLKEEIFDRVVELRKRKESVNRVASQISREFNRDIPIELIREIYQDIKLWKKNSKEVGDIIDDLQSKQSEKDDWGLKELANAEKPHKKYDVSDRHYIFYKDDKPYPVLISTVRAIFESYSSNWKNLSWEEIRQKFKLPAGIFELIKSSTWLYKASHIDDPVTLERLQADWLEDYIWGRVEDIITDKYIETYTRAVKNKQKKDLDMYAKTNRGYDLFMSKLEEAIKNYNPIDFDNIKLPEILNNDTRDVFITDAHLGKKWTDWIVTRFLKITRDLIETPEKNINITFGGDIAECFLPIGEMHPSQRLGMEEITSENLIMLAVDVFQKMLVDLYKAWKTVTFNWLGWNHDRLTEKKEFDPYRTPAMVIYRFIQRLVEDTNIKINILRDKANIVKSGKIKYVFIHWDGLSEAELKRRALNDIEDWYYLVYCTGDKHNFKMSELSDRILWVQSPALAWPWQYDKSLALTSQSGAIFFDKNKEWLLEFTVKRYL